MQTMPVITIITATAIITTRILVILKKKGIQIFIKLTLFWICMKIISVILIMS